MILLIPLYTEDKNDLEKNRAVRRRFRNVISRFTQTFEKGLWESAIVDIVILMELILLQTSKVAECSLL